MHIAADFSLNLLDHDKNRKVHNVSINQELLINQLGLEKKKLQQQLTIISATLSLTQSLKQQF